MARVVPTVPATALGGKEEGLPGALCGPGCSHGAGDGPGREGGGSVPTEPATALGGWDGGSVPTEPATALGGWDGGLTRCHSARVFSLGCPGQDKQDKQDSPRDAWPMCQAQASPLVLSRATEDSPEVEGRGCPRAT